MHSALSIQHRHTPLTRSDHLSISTTFLALSLFFRQSSFISPSHLTVAIPASICADMCGSCTRSSSVGSAPVQPSSLFQLQARLESLPIPLSPTKHSALAPAEKIWDHVSQPAFCSWMDFMALEFWWLSLLWTQQISKTKRYCTVQ